MKIAIGSDHAGFRLKELLKSHLLANGYEVVDCGTDNGDISVDYPVYGEKVGRAVSGGEASYGVVCCGSAIGISIAANKIDGIRAAHLKRAVRMASRAVCSIGFASLCKSIAPSRSVCVREGAMCAFWMGTAVRQIASCPYEGSCRSCSPRSLRCWTSRRAGRCCRNPSP